MAGSGRDQRHPDSEKKPKRHEFGGCAYDLRKSPSSPLRRRYVRSCKGSRFSSGTCIFFISPSCSQMTLFCQSRRRTATRSILIIVSGRGDGHQRSLLLLNYADDAAQMTDCIHHREQRGDGLGMMFPPANSICLLAVHVNVSSSSQGSHLNNPHLLHLPKG